MPTHQNADGTRAASKDRSRPIEYFFAFLVTLGAAFLEEAAASWIHPAGGFALYLLAVVLSAWRFGVGPSVLSLLLGTASAQYSLVDPVGAFEFRSPSQLINFLLHLGLGIGIVTFGRSLRAAQRRLSLRERHHRAFFEAAAVGAAEIDPSTQRFLTVNRTLCKMTGFDAEELRARTLRDLTDMSDRAGSDRALADALERRGPASWLEEKRIVRRDARNVWVLTSATILFGIDDKPERQMALIQDITALKEAEESLREADRRKDEFLALLAHELRNPMAALVGSLEVMRDYPIEDSRIRRELARMDRQVGQLRRLIDDLLDVSRITRGKLQLRFETVDLAEILRHAVEESEALWRAKRHLLSVCLPEHPVQVRGDAARLAQVFTNLLDNAAKYTPPEGSIEVVVEDRAEGPTVRVRDSGEGMTPEVIERAFQLFVQGDRSLSRAHGGLGIGLTLVRGLLEMHGGTIEAFSEGPGRGSEFRVHLPPAIEQTTAVRTAGPSVPRENAHSRRILVVDDNADALETLKWVLERHRHDVRTASSGASALDIAQSFAPEVVLLDVGMPGMDGYEVARRLRGSSSQERTRLVAVTGYGLPEDRRRAMEAGFDVHLVKPVDPKTLLEAIA